MQRYVQELQFFPYDIKENNFDIYLNILCILIYKFVDFFYIKYRELGGKILTFFF